jgi:hypothetical protein
VGRGSNPWMDNVWCILCVVLRDTVGFRVIWLGNCWGIAESKMIGCFLRGKEVQVLCV